jgi:hypothetical protein
VIADAISTLSVGSLTQLPLQAFSFRLAILKFIENQLDSWRRDPSRSLVNSENALSDQLCIFLNSACRKAKGFDGLQFNREAGDEIKRQRTVDLSVNPLDDSLFVDGRSYNKYERLLSLECKRLPTPSGTDRDEREYLYSQFGLRGGIQRYKCGSHSSQHNLVGMIGYIQYEDSRGWQKILNQWIDSLAVEDTSLEWSSDDYLTIKSLKLDDPVLRLSSVHTRLNDLPKLQVEHIWVRMTTAQ